VFETAVITRVLERLPDDQRVDRMLEHARCYLRDEREPSGLWRYFGHGCLIPADADDTACAMQVLAPKPIDQAVIKAMLDNRDPSGAVFTWFLDPETGPPHRNSIDACVNANVHALLLRRGMVDPDIQRYLERLLETRRYREESPYYASPFCFLYAMAEIGNGFSSATTDRVRAEVLELLSNKPDRDVVEDAMACSALARLGAAAEEWRPLLKRVRHWQQPDGGWPLAPLYQGLDPLRTWFGSRESVTAICLEALCIEAGVVSWTDKAARGGVRA